MKFPKVNPKQSFPELEEKIIKDWEENDTFKKSIETRKDSEEFNFYDGPPFATGTPHYGHILAGTIKDVVPRYQTMKGKKVERNFGWDCHGLPIENIVEKKMEITGKDDIENRVGVYDFNESCRANVFWYVDEWKKIVKRMGRWVDMENDYKTMDTNFMESVWWVYKTIYDKGLIYEGHRVVPYCPRCSTPLSNFEVNQGYKDKQSKTATVKFKVKGSENKYILAWTTTPWTLYANLGLAVGEDITYVELLDKTNGDTYILAREKVKDYFNPGVKKGVELDEETDSYKILREYKGKCLAGIAYEALFPDFDIQLNDMGKDLGNEVFLWKNAYRVVLGHHVTTETGTGIVHIAPAYGEDDNIIGEKEELGFVIHIDDSGKTYNLLDKNGIPVGEFNEAVLSELKEKKLALHIGTINHSYPHCWRCDTPLIYRAISAWYVAVEKIRERMLANNEKIHWVPEIIKHGRFWKWLEQARDWNISRNRYWGSAIPIWQSPDKKQEVCIGSKEELYQRNKDFWQITKVIFVRHGRTDYNEKRWMDFEGKAQLSEDGKKQAEAIKEKLKWIDIDCIFSSPLDRCIDTMNPLAKEKNLEIKTTDALREINSPDLQDKEYSCKNYKWENGYGWGEKVKEVYARVETELKKIIDENKGKTIVICSHGDPLVLMRKVFEDYDYETEKYENDRYLENNPKYGVEKMYQTHYVYSNTYRLVDLHKHFVDEIILKGEENIEIKNVLGIHGRTSSIKKESWKKKQELFNEQWLNLELYQFDNSENPTYESWKETFETIDFSKYNAVFTSSLWGAMTVNYLCEKKIKIKRLVMLAPWKWISWRQSTAPLYENLEEKGNVLKNLVNEIIVIHSKDDEVVPLESGKNFANKMNAEFIKVSKTNHKYEWYEKFCAEIVKNWTPLQRIPEVLDCWFESGAMPYASKHYPFKYEWFLDNNKNSPSEIIWNPSSDTLSSFKFPADFIAEGLDQTRGWFYTLIILGTALFDNTPFLNCIVNGIILAEDGKKMSKRLKNYPDPEALMHKHGADAMRFYMINSPVVEAQDLRFSESWVEEVVKKVILPLWNTYSFFTTYANIDNWSPKKWNIYYCRHGQTNNNKNNIMNGGDENDPLNEKWRNQAHEAGKNFALKNEKIDIIISSHLSRAYDTAKIIAEEIGYTGEIVQDKRLRDQDSGVLRWKNREALKKEFNLRNDAEFRKFFRDKNNNTVESVEEFNARAKEAFEEIQEKYAGKNVLIIGHAGTIRPILKKLNNMTKEEAFYEMPSPPNAKVIKLPSIGRKNVLDKWIIGELHSLIAEVEEAMNAYKLNEATKPITGFMDKLTNWYIRRSRKRFWKSENDTDKLEAYETLYEVLVEITKIIAPFMPFIADHIYKNLTGKTSVHLDIFPDSIHSFIDKNTNAQFDKTAKLVNLGLAWRQRNNLRVRQPLKSATIGEKLDAYYQEILKEELNVKEIITLDNPDKIAKKICKPNARIIGPKFGKDVKFIMSEAKSGNFEEKENGKIKVWDFILENWEYEIAFEAGETDFDIEAGFGMVIALDKNLTPELIEEGLTRDIVRHIQEARKEANFEVDDRIKLSLSGEWLENIIKNFWDYIEKETLSTLVETIDNPDMEKEIEVEGKKIKLGVKK